MSWFSKILMELVNKTELYTIDKVKLKRILNAVPSAGINQHHPIHRVPKISDHSVTCKGN